MRVWSIVVPDAVCVVSTISASDDTVTVSVAAATDNCTVSSATCPIVSRTDWLTILAKPGASTVTEYGPGGSDNRIAIPSAFVVAVREMPLPASAAVMDAPLTTAPLASFTSTCNSEVCTCAQELPNRHATATKQHNTFRAAIMVSSSNVGLS